jgi:hypothetical protein
LNKSLRDKLCGGYFVERDRCVNGGRRSLE